MQLIIWQKYDARFCTWAEIKAVFSSAEYINVNEGDREREREGNRRRRSIDGVIELICQFANYTDEFVWWPRVSLRSSIATGSAVGCLSYMFSTRVREIATCDARACTAPLRAHVHAARPRVHSRATTACTGSVHRFNELNWCTVP